MSLDFSIFIDYGPRILVGFWLTIKIVVLAIAFGLPLGDALALARRSRLRCRARSVAHSRAARGPSATTVARAPGGPVTDALPSVAGAVAGGLTRSAARAELRTTLGAINTMAANAGGANAVRLMRRVRTVGNASDLATMSARFGRSTRAVVELTGKTALRSFRVAVRGAKMLIAFLYSFVAWLAGLLVLGTLKQIYRAFMWTTRGLVFAFWVP